MSEAKKRGRKSKGGKIIQTNANSINTGDIKPNIILHLNCSTKELYNNFTNQYDSYQHDIIYEEIELKTQNQLKTQNPLKTQNQSIDKCVCDVRMNSTSHKKSDCFWCKNLNKPALL